MSGINNLIVYLTKASLYSELDTQHIILPWSIDLAGQHNYLLCQSAHPLYACSTFRKSVDSEYYFKFKYIEGRASLR